MLPKLGICKNLQYFTNPTSPVHRHLHYDENFEYLFLGMDWLQLIFSWTPCTYNQSTIRLYEKEFKESQGKEKHFKTFTQNLQKSSTGIIDQESYFFSISDRKW